MAHFPVSGSLSPCLLYLNFVSRWAGRVQEFHCHGEIGLNHRFRKLAASTAGCWDQMASSEGIPSLAGCFAFLINTSLLPLEG